MSTAGHSLIFIVLKVSFLKLVSCVFVNIARIEIAKILWLMLQHFVIS